MERPWVLSCRMYLIRRILCSVWSADFSPGHAASQARQRSAVSVVCFVGVEWVVGRSGFEGPVEKTKSRENQVASDLDSSVPRALGLVIA